MPDNMNSEARIQAATKRGDELGDNHINILRGALVVARDHYEKIRAEMQAFADKAASDPAWYAEQAKTMMHPRIYAPMVKQFAGQVAEVDSMIDWLDGPEEDNVEDVTILRRITLA